MSVALRFYRANNYNPSLTLEEIFKLYGSWSGLHDFSFDPVVSDATTTVTGTVSGGFTVGTLYPALLPPSFEIRYHKTTNRQAVFIQGGSGAIYFIAGTDDSGYPFISRFGATVQSIPKATPEEADVRVVFRQQQNSDDETQIWRSVSIYMNDALITTFQEPWNLAYSNIQIGFAAYDTDVVTYTNIIVPELCDIAEFGTLDPGATPTNGLQQTIEGRYLKYFVRFDGTFRAWKVKSIDSQHTFTNDEFISDTIPNDFMDLATHVRMMGAYIWAEAIDYDLANLYGHRFQEVNNSMLMTKQECFIEATNTLKRMQENTFTQSADVPYVPMIEVEDRVTTADGDWIVTGYQLDLDVAEVVAGMNVRKYMWGTP